MRMNSLGIRIKEERMRRGWTLEELARRANVSKTLISELENDPNRGTTKLLQLARAFKMNPVYLETGKGPRDNLVDPAGAYISAESIEDLADKLVARGDEEVIKLWRAILAAKTK